ncbi:transcription factor bHLH18 [Brachypodium distachyon]|uniref:BHLH domain-containing protein n=1 Tax=Brachypodium distachyon TaxID=15368 RepID=A0A0Q3KS32_BRADI|nr:transcription factor bHLH18 [Brachypodium distachyon]KQK13833.1 hypothetical protein BRADI_1g12770v3 [Brachypodium distachyon]|eukprot:XP_003559601.1 transcription factor bHLH18 [Brachypodium distachyon]
MDESALFMEWAMETLEHEHLLPPAVVSGGGDEANFPSLQALRDVSHAALVLEELLTDAHAANSGSSGDTDGGSGGGVHFSSTAPGAMDQQHDVWLPPSPPANANASGNGGGPNVSLPGPVMSWNFSAASAQPAADAGAPDAAAARLYEPGLASSQTSRRASANSTASTGHTPTPAPYAQDHIIAERKRREKINQRFIELSTVIPGLKKMDKATILSDATRHVKDLQEKIKALEAASGSNSRSVETVVLVKKPCYGASEDNGSSGAPAPGRSLQPLPEIEARFAENGVMVRILCEDAKGVVVRVLSEVEDGLRLSVTHANVMAFTACTLIITITAKVEEGSKVTAEEVVGRLNSALQQHSTSTSTEETGNY